jgi:hypothetical protein
MRSVIDSSGPGSSLLQVSSSVVRGSVSSFAPGQLQLAAQDSYQSSLALVWSSDHSCLSILNDGAHFRRPTRDSRPFNGMLRVSALVER